MEFKPLNYIYIPSDTISDYTFLLLHGTGGNENDLVPLVDDFGGGVNILRLRGNVLENGMPRFFKRLAMGVFDEADLEFRTRELVHFVREIAIEEGFDIMKLIAIGYSNGANIAGSTLALYPNFLAGAILFRPMRPFKHLEVHKIENQTAVFITSGKFDPLVSSAASDAYASFLESSGNEVEYNLLEASHNLTKEDLELAISWYKRIFR